MKKGIIFVVMLFLLAGCATIGNPKAREERARAEKVGWWNTALGGNVIDVEEDYVFSDIPHSRVKTTNGTLVFY